VAGRPISPAADVIAYLIPSKAEQAAELGDRVIKEASGLLMINCAQKGPYRGSTTRSRPPAAWAGSAARPPGRPGYR
jgi:hypothetical protein